MQFYRSWKKKICKKKKLGKWHYTKRMSDGTYKVLNKFQSIGWFDCESKCMRIVFFYGCLQLFHEFHLEFYYYRRRATNWSKKWHKDRKNGREREREKENKIKIQDGFQVLSNRFKWNYLVFYLKKGISFTLSLSLSLKFFCSFAESKSKIKLEIFFILSIREKDF